MRLWLIPFLTILSACATSPLQRENEPPRQHGTFVIFSPDRGLEMTSAGLLAGDKPSSLVPSMSANLTNIARDMIRQTPLDPRVIGTLSLDQPATTLQAAGEAANAAWQAESKELLPNTYLLIEPGPEISDPMLQTGKMLGGIGALHVVQRIGNGPTHAYAFVRLTLLDKDFKEIARSDRRAAYDLSLNSRYRADEYRWPANWSRATVTERKPIEDAVRELIKQVIQGALEELKLVKKSSS